MNIKRRVSSNLGRTQHQHAEQHYAEIKKRIGPCRACPFYGGKKYPLLSPAEHDKLNPDFPNPNVPIEQYDFAQKKKEMGLQAYCKVCYKAYRDARIGLSRSSFSTMDDAGIYAWYLKNVGPTMRCSVCKRELSPTRFAISRSMEKGLHNECRECQIARANSVREKEWLSGGDWSSWEKAVRKIRMRKKVLCAGWSRSVAAGVCEKNGTGKEMHMDHIIPLRAGGIHDKRNLQSLCTQCNIRKSDQIDLKLSAREISKLVGTSYKGAVRVIDSISTIERKLKNALVQKVGALIRTGEYRNALRAKKKEVNGQWDVLRAERKGREWFFRFQAGRDL